MGGSLSLLPSAAEAVDDGSPRLYLRDAGGGARVEVLEGDVVMVLGPGAAAGQRMQVVRLERAQARVVVRAAGARGGEEAAAEESALPLEQLELLCEGVTAARQQMRRLLALYCAHCAREATAPHEGLVQGIEHSVRTAHVGGEGKVCLNLSSRALRDTELLMLNAALLPRHGGASASAGGGSGEGSTPDAEDGVPPAADTLPPLPPATPPPLTPASAASAAACGAVTVVDVSSNKISSEGAATLCALLVRDMPFVEELYLDSNNISDGIENMLPPAINGTRPPPRGRFPAVPNCRAEASIRC